jgi:tetratricopeptide (TPR) repeat protein
MKSTCHSLSLWASRSLVVGLLIGRLAAGAELPAPEEVVAQAGKACDALNAAGEPDRLPGAQEKLERGLRQRAWQRLALARVNLGDFDGAVEALNHVNTDPRFSEASVQAMRTELTGDVAPWPEDLPPRLKETQKQVLADILRKQDKFEAALKMAADIADQQIRARATAQTLLARSQALERTDRTGALQDQLEVMKLASSIRDVHLVLSFQYQVCRGQIRIGPPGAARPTIEAVAHSLKGAEEKTARPNTIQEWARIGELYLLVDDQQSADKCFEHAQEMFEKSFPGKAWEESLPHQLTLNYRCQAYRNSERPAAITGVLDEWERAFSYLTDPKDVAFVAPYLIRHEIQADRFHRASAIIDGLEGPGKQTPPGVLAVVQQAANEIVQSSTADQMKTFAEYVKTLLREQEVLHLPIQIVAAELFDRAGDRKSADASLDEALKISSKRNKSFHAMLAGWLAENGRFEKAYDLISAMDVPQQRAQALCELAFHITKPRKPRPDAAAE